MFLGQKIFHHGPRTSLARIFHKDRREKLEKVVDR